MLKNTIRSLIMALFLLMPMGMAGRLLASDSAGSGQRILVQDFRFSGNSAISAAALASVVESSKGKELSLAELQAVADKVSDYYRTNGYFLAKALLPEQDISGGVVNMEILEGKLGKVVINGNHHYSSYFLQQYFNRIRRQGVIKQDVLERALLLMNTLPNLKVTSVLQAGAEKGTTDIIVTVVEGKQTRSNLEMDNFGSRYSRVRAQAGVDFLNQLHRGDVLSLGGLTGVGSDKLYYFNLNTSIPIDANGTHIGFYGLSGDFGIGKEFAVLNIQGKASAYGLSFNRTISMKRKSSLVGEAGLDWKNSRQNILSTNSSNDNIVSLRLALKTNSSDARGKTFGGATIQQGLGHNLGGMETDDPRSSRASAGADNSFTKINLEFARVQSLSPQSFLLARFMVQITNKSLVAGEQMAIGGADSVRGYSQSEYSGDGGYQFSLEGRFAKSPEMLNKLQFAVFGDLGHISVKSPVLGQVRSKTLTGLGIGLRFYPGNDLFIRADVGFPAGGKVSGDKSALPYLQIYKTF